MSWFSVKTGEQCPFDPPRTEPNGFWDSVATLEVCTLCLLKNQAYRGHSILIYDPRHVSRPDELTADEWSAFARDAHAAVRALVAVFRPDHINIESLGNEVPHLHWHLIPRYRDDPRWGGPVWTTTREEMARGEMSGPERQQAIEELRTELTRVRL